MTFLIIGRGLTPSNIASAKRLTRVNICCPHKNQQTALKVCRKNYANTDKQNSCVIKGNVSKVQHKNDVQSFSKCSSKIVVVTLSFVVENFARIEM